MDSEGYARSNSYDTDGNIRLPSGTYGQGAPRSDFAARFVNNEDDADRLLADENGGLYNEDDLEEDEIPARGPNQFPFRYSTLMEHPRRLTRIAEEHEQSSQRSSKRSRSCCDGDDEEDGSDASGRRVRVRYSDEEADGSYAPGHHIFLRYSEPPQESLEGDEHHPIHIPSDHNSDVWRPEAMRTSDAHHRLCPHSPGAYRALRPPPSPESEMNYYESFSMDEEERPGTLDEIRLEEEVENEGFEER